MPNKQSSVLTAIAPVVFSLLIGGIFGYCLHGLAPAAPPPPAQASAAPPPARETGRGEAGGRVNIDEPTNATALLRLVHHLAILESVQNKGLNAEQTKQILPILEKLQSADKLTTEEAMSNTQTLADTLTKGQFEEVQSLGGTNPTAAQNRPFVVPNNKMVLQDLIAKLRRAAKS